MTGETRVAAGGSTLVSLWLCTTDLHLDSRRLVELPSYACLIGARGREANVVLRANTLARATAITSRSRSSPAQIVCRNDSGVERSTDFFLVVK